MENISPLKRQVYSQKVIPLAFDESLSYLEQIGGIKYKINEIIEFIDDVLEEKINDYINSKFNDMMINSMYDAQTETLILYLDSNGGGN